MSPALNSLIPILGIIFSIGLPIATGGYLLLIHITSRHKERMEQLKQGIIPESQPKPMPNKYVSLRNGFLCIGIALGTITGIITIHVFNLIPPIQVLCILSSIILFMGAAYILFYVMIKNKDIQD